jgi:hypothetical protein
VVNWGLVVIFDYHERNGERLPIPAKPENAISENASFCKDIWSKILLTAWNKSSLEV